MCQSCVPHTRNAGGGGAGEEGVGKIHYGGCGESVGKGELEGGGGGGEEGLSESEQFSKARAIVLEGVLVDYFSKKPYSLSKKPYSLSKEPYSPSKEHCFPSKEPYSLSKEPVVYQKSPMIYKKYKRALHYINRAL